MGEVGNPTPSKTENGSALGAAPVLHATTHGGHQVTYILVQCTVEPQLLKIHEDVRTINTVNPVLSNHI